MLWSIEAVLAATGGRVAGRSDGVTPSSPSWRSVTIDSRQAGPESLFVPVQADRDGHDFVADAVVHGSTGYLVAAGHRLLARLPAGLAIEVEDTGAALLDIGRAARRRLEVPTIGITGSVGKTSTKDLLAAALATRWRVTASARSFNTELGVPLTLANADLATEVTVIEMGARGKGHIALLCDVARPSIAVVTAVAAVHTEMFGTIEAVAAAKAELVEFLGPEGTAVLNVDDPHVAAMAGRTKAEIIRYSAAAAKDADVIASGVRVDDDLRASFVISSPWGRGEVTLGAHGAHQVGNALGAATAALRCDVAFDDVLEGLATAVVSPWRMELHRTPAGAVIINDAYNANPTSMAAALRSLAALPARRRVAILGEMAELGAGGDAEHLAVAARAAAMGVELIAFDTDRYAVPAVTTLEAAVEAVGPLGAGDAVLVKASRVVSLERLVPLLTG
jgi:UDP-N-acetylmuramoyl-tripeptide--D-alanyl-D-alanine ligase